MPIKNEVFDSIFMIEVLDYIPELNQVFDECKRALKQKATCFLSFGNKSSIKSKIKETHGNGYRHSYKNVMTCLAKSGLVVEKKRGFNWMLFGRTSQNTLVPLSANVEKLLGLRRIPRFSPWVILNVTKSP